MGLSHVTDDIVRRLAASVIRQAIVGLKGPDTIRALDAALWFTGPDTPFWLEALDMQSVDASEVLASGRLLQIGRVIHAHAKGPGNHER